MTNAVYIISIVILISLSLLIRRKLEKQFYKKDMLPINLYLDRRFFILALFFPKDYFKEKNFWKGYSLYILSLGLFAIAIYLFAKFIGLM